MTPLRGLGVAILLTWDGWPCAGPGPHMRCVAGSKEGLVHVEAVGFPSRAAAVTALEEVKETIYAADLVPMTGASNPLTISLYPTITVRRST